MGTAGRRVPEAVKVNTQILELDPDNLPALTRRGLCYLNLGKYLAAKEDLSRALQRYPASTLVKEALRRIEREQNIALQQERERERQQAEERRRRIEGRRKRQEERHLRAKDEEARLRAAEAAWRRTAEELRAVEQLTDFEEAYALGVAASKASVPNYPLAIAALKKAYRLDPRKRIRRGENPDPGLFEVPTRLAAVYRLSGRRYEAEKMYKWVLDRQDSRFARVGLAAVLEDNSKHSQALMLYEGVLDRHPNDSYALRGVARTLANLGRIEDAVEAYKRAAKVVKNQQDVTAIDAALKELREALWLKLHGQRATGADRQVCNTHTVACRGIVQQEGA